MGRTEDTTRCVPTGTPVRLIAIGELATTDGSDRALSCFPEWRINNKAVIAKVFKVKLKLHVFFLVDFIFGYYNYC